MRTEGRISTEGKNVQMVNVILNDGLSSSVIKSRCSFLSGMDGSNLTACDLAMAPYHYLLP